MSEYPSHQPALSRTHRYDIKQLKSARTAENLCPLIQDNMAYAIYWDNTISIGQKAVKRLNEHFSNCRECIDNYEQMDKLRAAYVNYVTDHGIPDLDNPQQFREHFSECAGCTEAMRKDLDPTENEFLDTLLGRIRFTRNEMAQIDNLVESARGRDYGPVHCSQADLELLLRSGAEFKRVNDKSNRGYEQVVVYRGLPFGTTTKEPVLEYEQLKKNRFRRE